MSDSFKLVRIKIQQRKRCVNGRSHAKLSGQVRWARIFDYTISMMSGYFRFNFNDTRRRYSVRSSAVGKTF